MQDAAPWLIFFVSAAAVVIAGSGLARFGDRISEESGIGGIWVGAFAVAAVTSLPEVVTDTTAAWIEEPDLAVGDLFGSCMANMMVLAILDLAHRQHRVWQRVSVGNAVVAALAMALVSLAAAFIATDLGWSIGWVGVDTLAVAGLYILGSRVVFRHEYLAARARIAEKAAEAEGIEVAETGLTPPSRVALLGFATTAAVIIVAGPFVALSADEIADQTGIGASFVGVTFLAITTSLPELTAGITAVRLGAYDLAVGNLFGSNTFNMFALVFVDVAYRPGPVLSDVSQAQVVAGLAAMLLMATGVMGVLFRAERRYLLIEPDAAAMIAAYVIGMLMVYHVGG